MGRRYRHDAVVHCALRIWIHALPKVAVYDARAYTLRFGRVQGSGLSQLLVHGERHLGAGDDLARPDGGAFTDGSLSTEGTQHFNDDGVPRGPRLAQALVQREKSVSALNLLREVEQDTTVAQNTTVLVARRVWSTRWRRRWDTSTVEDTAADTLRAVRSVSDTLVE